MTLFFNNKRGSSAMNVSLTAELESLVNKKVKSGLSNSASEVVREALRLLKEQDELKRIRYQELKADIKSAVGQMDRGEFTTYDSPDEILKHVKAEGRKRLAAKNKPRR